LRFAEGVYPLLEGLQLGEHEVGIKPYMHTMAGLSIRRRISKMQIMEFKGLESCDLTVPAAGCVQKKRFAAALHLSAVYI
jgi:hypothetical protein